MVDRRHAKGFVAVAGGEVGVTVTEPR
ncbi:MAG: hypothetical protein K0Q71_5999, partial [Thermomicrobiales bacterium]|nr:hypothetical protein [Thermomicrobiales bacterium]